MTDQSVNLPDGWTTETVTPHRENTGYLYTVTETTRVEVELADVTIDSETGRYQLIAHVVETLNGQLVRSVRVATYTGYSEGQESVEKLLHRLTSEFTSNEIRNSSAVYDIVTEVADDASDC